MKSIALLLIFYAFAPLHAEVRLPVIFSDHMVIQRGVEAPVWGWAEPGEKVRVSFAGNTVLTRADHAGKWSVKLPALAASASPRELTVTGGNKITFENVLVGDVWICSGQSNMEWPLRRSSKTAKEDAAAEQNNAQLRLFRIPEHIKLPEPAEDTEGTWTTTATVEDSLKFSGCGFYFGARLQRELDIPIGLIDSSWGGTPVDLWISKEAFKGYLGQERKGGGIYNGMVAPLVPFAIKGVIWYQGESNRRDAYPAYFTKLEALIGGWRDDFQVGDFPFYLVHIAPFQYKHDKPEDNDQTLCDNIWAAQYKAADEIKNCGLVPIHDTIRGVIHDIHPWDKRPVGERLANLALKQDYGQDLPWTGPEFASARLKRGEVVVSFDHIDEGLTTNDGKAPTHFELAGADQVFVPAQATIKGDAVVVSAAQLASPKYVRMGWNETAVPNLADKNGWPVFQFPAKKVR